MIHGWCKTSSGTRLLLENALLRSMITSECEWKSSANSPTEFLGVFASVVPVNVWALNCIWIVISHRLKILSRPSSKGESWQWITAYPWSSNLRSHWVCTMTSWCRHRHSQSSCNLQFNCCCFSYLRITVACCNIN